MDKKIVKIDYVHSFKTSSGRLKKFRSEIVKETDLLTSFIDALKQIKKENNFTEVQLAQYLETTRMTLNKIYARKITSIQIELIEKIKKNSGYTYNQLFGGEKRQ